MTFVLGLTGSIGMGKSATAMMFREAGVPVYDADAAVHALYRGLAVPLVEAAFPGTTRDGVVDREKLGAAVLGNAEAMRQLERIVHPLLRNAQRSFLEKAVSRPYPVVVLDIPLLFETGGEARCDAVVVVSTPPAVQKARVLARPGMTEEKFNLIHVKQMPDADKRRRAHFVIDTSRGFDAARLQVKDVLRAIAPCSGGAIHRALAAASPSDEA